MSMEVQTSCADGECFEQKTLYAKAELRDFRGVADLIQKTYMFDPNGQDPREEIPRNGYFGPVAEIYAKGNLPDGRELRSRGTAFWISPCHLLTNHHALVPKDTIESTCRHRIKFGPGDNDVTSAQVLGGNQLRDWAVLRVNKCKGNELGWFELSKTRPEIRKAGIAGFYRDYDAGKLRGQMKRKCNVPPPGDGYLWQHYCPAKEATSGAPLFYEGPCGQPVVFALNRDEAPPMKDDPAQSGDTFRTEESRHANLALDISTIYLEIQALLNLENMTAGWEKTNPLIRKTQ